ncbi:MAG TPA: hypothetical protein VEG65_03005 [Candidatus Bathyarchaeia archaeon]|nr:hypothetical protein [Candidatus Bathyarchaeia archaeon]
MRCSIAFALIRDEFPMDKVPPATGVVTAMFAVGATGLVRGGWIGRICACVTVDATSEI